MKKSYFFGLALALFSMVATFAYADNVISLDSSYQAAHHLDAILPDISVKVEVEKQTYRMCGVTYLTLLSESSAKLSAHNSSLCQAKDEVGWKSTNSLESVA
jgi:hypothetical protein